MNRVSLRHVLRAAAAEEPESVPVRTPEGGTSAAVHRDSGQSRTQGWTSENLRLRLKRTQEETTASFMNNNSRWKHDTSIRVL